MGVMATLIGACQRDLSSNDEPIVVLAAASLHAVMSDLAAEFTAAHGTPVRLVSGGSNVLATQIQAGAPADLFVSAHEEWAQLLAADDRIDEEAPIAGNALVILVPRGNPMRIENPEHLLTRDLSAIALAGAQVPAGRFATMALEHLCIARPTGSPTSTPASMRA